MRISAISDMHGMLPEPRDIPECDLLLIAGDICPVRDHSLERQAKWIEDKFLPWLNSVNATEVVGIAGNHDFIAEQDPALMYDLPWDYLESESIDHFGHVIHGTPWTPTFGPWAFMMDDDDLVRKWQKIPDNTTILVSHGPAAGIGDMTSRGIDAGSVTLRERIDELTELKLHVFGHIHEAFGDFDGPHGAIYSNISMVDLQYRPRPIASLRTFEL